jgi:beta-1,4-N-acetylglucosaminyltransferase
VLLVCSPGGHLFQMLCLEDAWSDLDRTWVTLEAPDAEHLLEDDRVVFAHGPTNRSIRALLANLGLAWRLVRRERPDAILSTGAALALPFFLVGKLYGAKLIYVESLTRTAGLSLTGRLVYPLAGAFFVQWPAAAQRARARFAGNLL